MTAAKELAEFAAKKFGKTALRGSSQEFAERIVFLGKNYSDDLSKIIAKLGPKALNLADDAGQNAPNVLKFLAAHGDDGLHVLSSPHGMELFTKFGDDAAKVLIDHSSVAAPLMRTMGDDAVKAFSKLAPQSGRRLAMMADETSPQMLGVIGKYGDPAMDFIWKHRKVLAGTAAMTAFLSNPEPYINGTKELTTIVTENVVKPTVEAVGEVAGKTVVAVGGVTQQAVSLVGWILIFLSLGIVGGAVFVAKSGAMSNPAVQGAVKGAVKVAGHALGGRIVR